MLCPLCESQKNKTELFVAANAFTSSGKLDIMPTQWGGGIAKFLLL